MNMLSWVIYLVGLVEKVGDNLFGPMFLTFMLGAAGLFGYIMFTVFSSSTPSYSYGEDRTKVKEEHDKFCADGLSITKKFMKYGISLWVFFAFVNIVIPTKQTMILIAASEVSETVLKSELTQKALGQVGEYGGKALGQIGEYGGKAVTGVTEATGKALSGVGGAASEIGGIGGDSLKLLKTYIATAQADLEKKNPVAK